MIVGRRDGASLSLVAARVGDMQFDDASKALVEFAASRHNAFHSNEVADITPARRLRRAELRGELLRLQPRVWSVAALGHPPGQAARSAVIARAGAAVAYRTAAWLHRWVDVQPAQPEIWVPGSGRTATRGAHRFWCARVDPAVDLTVIDHIPSLSAAATLCLLGRAEPPATVERCLDEFTRQHSERWLVETLDRLHAPNCRGTSTLAKILGDPRRIARPTESWFERVVADLVAGECFPPVELQYPVAANGQQYRIDIALPTIRLGIEAHSRTFHWGPGAADADNQRDLLLSGAGWQLLYVTWSQLHDPSAFVDQLTRVVAARRATFADNGSRS